MLGTLITALVIVIAAVAVGRTAMLVFGWRRPEWMAGAVGLALLVTLAPFLVRLPGRGLTAAILLGLLVAACTVVTRRAVPNRTAGPRTSRSGRITPYSGTFDAWQGDAAACVPRAQHLVALGVVAAVLAMACLPFLFNERTGVLGEGIYTNDQAAQLFWADWLADGFGPQPNAVKFGYPVGPQALAASVSKGTGVNLVDTFNGLLIAIPALTALAALSALAVLPPWRRALAAILIGLPYLGASFLAQSGFKETAMALFVVGLAVALHLASRKSGGREPPPARAVVAVLAILAAGSVFTFSVPGAAWFAVAIPIWAILIWGFGETNVDFVAARAWVVAHRRVLLAGGLLLAAGAALVLGPANSFISKIGDVQESSGRLSSPVWPGEALGVWPEGDFRLVRGEVSGALLATGFAALCVLGAVVAIIRRREWALGSTLAAAAFIYALSRPIAQIHVEAKALAVLAPIAMLVTVRWLLAPGERSPTTTARIAVGGLFALLALGSTLLALRAAPVGFDDRQRDLEVLAERIGPEDDVVFLGVDRFAGYYLRGTLTRSPGGYVPAEVGARSSKTWQQGEALDFDTLEPEKLNRQEFVITTTAAYQSTSPLVWESVAREGDYVLWQRSGEGPAYEVLPEEGGAPGAIAACAGSAAGLTGEVTVLKEPVVGEQDEWTPTFQFDAPATATQVLEIPDGEWAISIQYHSQVPLTVSADGEEVAELPASLEGFYLVGAGRGAFWPAGSLSGSEGPVEIEVEAAEPSGVQGLLGVTRRVWLGEVAATAVASPAVMPGSEACGEYVDHYLPDP